MTDIEITEEMAHILRTASPKNGLVLVPSDRPELDDMVRAGLLWEEDSDYFLDARGYEWLAGRGL